MILRPHQVIAKGLNNQTYGKFRISYTRTCKCFDMGVTGSVLKLKAVIHQEKQDHVTRSQQDSSVVREM